MNEIEIREYKDELRTELGMKPSDELLIDRGRPTLAGLR